MPDEFVTDAQRLIAEKRKIAERLLLEACMLEEQAATEAEVERCKLEHVASKERVDAVAAQEQRAHDAVLEIAEQKTALARDRADAEEKLATARSGAAATKAQIEELQRLLQDAQLLFDEAAAAVNAHEQRIAECEGKASEIERAGAEAEARVKEFQLARESAEGVAKAIAERLEELRRNLGISDDGPDAADTARDLAARIAQETSALKHETNHVPSSGLVRKTPGQGE
jgi:chromosome segregation ATPase